MSIMDMFKTASAPAPAPAPAPNASTPGNIPPGSGATDPNNPTAPAPGTPAPDGKLQSPLDAFNGLWEPSTNPGTDGDGNFSFNVDPKKLQEAAGKTNFTQNLTPELQARIVGGGEDGVRASMEMMNLVSQQVYAQSAFASTKMIEAAISKAQESFKSSIPNLVKRHSVSDNLRTKNPALSHPAAAPIVQAMEMQLSQKYPKATAAELTQLAEDYLVAFAGGVNPAPLPEPGSIKAGEVDWEDFLK